MKKVIFLVLVLSMIGGPYLAKSATLPKGSQAQQSAQSKNYSTMVYAFASLSRPRPSKNHFAQKAKKQLRNKVKVVFSANATSLKGPKAKNTAPLQRCNQPLSAAL